jgi:hypothetical protein
VKKLGILSLIKEAIKLFKQVVSGEKLEQTNKRTVRKINVDGTII